MQDSVTTNPITLTPQQRQALQQIERFLDSQVSVFILKGYAGTGKTTLLTYILKMLEERQRPYQLMAPTGRAAKVIRDKTGCAATTIHKGIYAFDRMVEQKKGEGIRLLFPLKDTQGVHPICIVDEASMVSSVKSSHEIYQFGSDVLLDDLLTYAAPNSGGKIIFIGDPAQLSPVTDSRSRALEESHFQSCGLQTMGFELTEVQRQADNAIARNALAIREMLRTNQFANFTFELKQSEVEVLPNIVENFCDHYDLESNHNPIVITYSNKKSQYYNQQIRSRLFPDKLHVAAGDVLMCVANNYNYSEPVFNGDFVRVISVNEQVEHHKSFTFIEKDGKKEKVPIMLSFREIVIQLSDGTVENCCVMEDLLSNDQPALSVLETNAMYVDFKLRYPKLVPGTEAFSAALQRDGYFNALRAKYGYAITGHKSQGGEWDSVYVDFSGRWQPNEQTLRWIYTVTTRAKKSLFAPAFPAFSNFKKFRMKAVAQVANMPADFAVSAKISSDTVPEQTPFHDSAAIGFLKAKFVAIESALKGTEFSIVEVRSYSYLEKYTIATPSGNFVFQGTYKKNGQFTFRGDTSCPECAELLALLNNPSAKTDEQKSTVFEYVASNSNLQDLFEDVAAICEKLDVHLANVVEHQSAYYVRYCFKTETAFSFIDFFFDKNGFITYGRPASSLGEADSILKKLIKEFLD